MLRYALPLSLAALLFGCNDESKDEAGASDPNVEDGQTGNDDNTNGPDDENDVGGGEPMALSNADVPCEDAGSAILAFDDVGNLFCGCGDQEGLWLLEESEDAEDGESGGSFQLVQGFESYSVYNLTASDDGSLYAVGQSDTSYVSHLTVSGSDGESVVTAETTLSLSVSSEIEYVADSCEDPSAESGSSFLSISGDYETLIWSNGLVSYDSADWEEENDEWSGETVSHAMFSLAAWSESWYGAGESEDGHPAIYAETEAMLDAITMATLEWDDTDGYFSDIESSSRGLFAVGYDAENGEGLGFWCDSGCGSEDAWDDLDLDLTGSGEGSLEGEITDIDFDDESGNYGMIVGSLSAAGSGSSADGEGFALFTADGGLTWHAINGDLPSLSGCTIDDEGNFALVGEAEGALMGSVKDYATEDGVEDYDN